MHLESNQKPLYNFWEFKLYDQIRMHIPDVMDQDTTCPKPQLIKLKKESSSNN